MRCLISKRDFVGPKRSDLKAMLENLGNNGEAAGAGTSRTNNNTSATSPATATTSNEMSEEGTEISLIVLHHALLTH